MTDKLETFIDEHLKEFDTIELPKDLWSKVDVRTKNSSVKALKSKLLSKLIYFGLSSVVIVSIVIYFISQKRKTSIVSSEKSKEILRGAENLVRTSEKNKNEEYIKQGESIFKDRMPIESKNAIVNDSASKENIIKLPLDSPKVDLKKFDKLVDIVGVPRHIFYHIGYNGGPINHKKSHKLFWYLHNEIPNTYYIVEHYIWNKWVERSKVKSGKSRPGRPQYSGEIIGKYAYSLHVPPHSGENRWRVVLTDSNYIQLAVSKELFGVDDKGKPLSLVPEVKYSIEKKTKEIVFSTDSYYELYDSSGKLITEGRGKTISYQGLEKGSYTLNYDNTTTTIKLK